MRTDAATYLCPSCRRPLDVAELVCPGGHRFACRDGVVQLLDAGFAERLVSFNAALVTYRDAIGRRLLDPSLYDRLPHGQAAEDFEWRLRVWDLDVLGRVLADRRVLDVLEIGSHNGWLARHLCDAGHRVTAIDYFDDPHDGLRARRFYSRATWTSIQMDLTDLSILPRSYDVVVLNRCLQFFPRPHAYLQEQVRPRARRGGVVVATGLDFFRRPETKRALVEERRRRYREEYGLDFFLHPTRGYLDFEDRSELVRAGFELRSYGPLWIRNLLSTVQPSRPCSCYGVWRLP